jgi:nucleoside-diphosphate-sugar epimerase
MKTLFLGSSGFVGSSLAKYFKEDDNSTFLLRQIKATTPLHQIIGDISDGDIRRKILNFGFERVIDCSWEGLPDLTEATNDKNLKMKLTLYDELIQSGVREINSIGSCLEYGTLEGKVSEDSIGVNVSNFGTVKLKILEQLKEYKIRFRWFRPFYLIGENQHPKSLINAAIDSMKSGLDFKPRNPGSSYDYISIRDAARGMYLSLNEQLCTGVINLGSGNDRSVNEIVNIVRAEYGFEQTQCARDPALISDCSKIQDLTGWKPRVSIEAEISSIFLSRGKH